MSREAAFDLNGRTVLITGAARGIGAASAERLHAKGANVALVGLEPERLEENAARLGERAAWFEADVTDFDALERVVRATVERFGAIDVAIANAGIAFTGSLAGSPVEQVERTLDVNLLGVWRTDRAVIGQIMERRGYLLNIASLAAIVHGALLGPYAAAKAGVEALSDALRVETSPSGARVGCAYFGFIDTDLVRASFAEPASEALRGQLPGFIRNPLPLSRAIDAIERGVERRADRVWAPRWVGAMLLARGLVQPLTERLSQRDPAALVEGMRLAGEQAGAQDPVLGIAAKALR
jgi:NAD(P)-dependent dehydrogenase (short-subunit alcohol dehydrogenase family)